MIKKHGGIFGRNPTFNDVTVEGDLTVEGSTVVSGGSIDGTPIGATTPSTGAFTTLSASSTTTLSGLTASTALALDASKNVVSVTNTGTGNNVLATNPTVSGATLTGGSINNTPIGATTPSTGAFTTLTENGFPVVSQTDIGTAANEIPLNQYLGSMAYQDVESVIADNVTITELLRVGAYTAATIPAAGTVGRVAYITDADDDLVWGDILDATGSNDTTYLFWDNGTNWTVIGK